MSWQPMKMNTEAKENSADVRIRMWPAVLVVSIQAIMIVTKLPFGENRVIHGWGLLLIWWLCFSRIPIRQRVIGLATFVGVGLVPRLLMHHSMDFVIFMYVVPTVTTAAILALLLTRFVPWKTHRWIGLSAAAIAFVGWTCVRVEGVSGNVEPDLAYRWSQTQEQAFLARATMSVGQEPNTRTDLQIGPGDWSSFRGQDRDSVVSVEGVDGCDIRLWAKQPPKELWRRRVGPAWSSYAVVDDRIFTQEQRDNREAVVCYDAKTGEQVWTHTYPGRFDEVLAGVGPRGTPTVDGNEVFTVGAKGIINCSDALTGERLWQRDLTQDTTSAGSKWGFSCSPLVVDDLVIVCAGGAKDDGIVAYGRDDGELRWTTGNGASYGSPQLVNIAGSQQLLMLAARGLGAFNPVTGAEIWHFDWDATKLVESRIVQPCVAADGTILIGSESGSIRLRILRTNEGWDVHEIWRSRHLKPDFNDMVVQGEHVFGFDGNLLCCIKTDDGKRVWRKRGYGKGQLMLVPEQNSLLVLSESGEVAVLEANPTACVEIARFQALEGKTWGHPVIARGRLFVRNAVEAACYQLPRSSE